MQSHNLPDLELYAFTDPAGGKAKAASAKHKKIRALQAAIVIATDHLQRIFVIHSWSGRLAPSAYLDKLITICDNYNPKIFGIEANAMQSLFADLVHTEQLLVAGVSEHAPFLARGVLACYDGVDTPELLGP